MNTEKFSVPEVSCQHCVNAITQEVKALPGVQRVDVSVPEKTVTVEHTPDLSQAQIIAAINEAGFEQVTALR